MKRNLLQMLALACCVSAHSAVAAVQSPAQILGWHWADNMCQGYFAQPHIVFEPITGAISKSKTTITSEHPAKFNLYGASTLSGNVVVNQPGRQLIADKATIIRNKQSGQVTHVQLQGNVHYREKNKLVVSRQAEFDLKQHRYILQNVLYHTKTQALNKKPINAWGEAKKATKEPNGILQLYHASYTTCSPTCNVWKIRASHIILDHAHNSGTAINARLEIKGVPILYTPYISFPLAKQRKSGFLFPTFGYEKKDGFKTRLPFYLNLAPNYDFTFSPYWYEKRGVQLNGVFRYLTKRGNGFMHFSFIPGDREFDHFKKDALNQIETTPSLFPYAQRIRNASDDRSEVNIYNNTQYSTHWMSNLNLNYVTDDYYLRDFGSTPNTINNDQLLNRADLTYAGAHWNFLTRIQSYQTLHPFNQQPPALDQYMRLPEFDWSANYPKARGLLTYQFDGGFVYFDHRRNFITGQTVPIGSRLHLQPSISMPLNWQGGYFTPQIQLSLTGYDIIHQTPGLKNDIVRALPIADIDAGLYLERNTAFLGHTYQQTLEPRLFYLYVPVTNQNDIPNFDTTLPPFNLSEMFRTNRFVGIDRIGDANQVTLALISRLLDPETGRQRLRASIGEVYYFNKRKVQLPVTANSPPDPTINDRFSPIIAQLTYYINQQWHASSTLAWDPNSRNFNNDQISLHYQRSPKQIFHVGYEFVRSGDPLLGQPTLSGRNNLNRIDLGLALPFNKHWSTVGNWNYNISHTHVQTYLYGVEYDSCCWALRIVSSRTFTGTDENNKNQFDNSVYVQVQLKSLGNFGNNDSTSVIQAGIPGYRDTFGG